MKPEDYDQAQSVLVKELVALRQRAGLSQRELANRIGQTQTAVQRIEHGRRRVDYIELAIICEACEEPVIAFCRRYHQILDTELSKNQD